MPEERYGFEKATREAVMRWRFEPARLGDEPVTGLFAGVVKFVLRPEEEADLAELARTALERWQSPEGIDRREEAPLAKIRGESVTPTEVIERRLAESFEASRTATESLWVDAIRFEGDDAWVTTTLRLSNETRTEPFRTLAVRRSSRWYALLSEIPHDAEAPPEGQETYDVDPIPVAKPSDPPYPSKAREARVSGHVVLRVRVELDGSTTVLRAVESLPFCTVPAIENARGWRWKPALDDGKPVPAEGIITVSFDLFANP